MFVLIVMGWYKSSSLRFVVCVAFDLIGAALYYCDPLLSSALHSTNEICGMYNLFIATEALGILTAPSKHVLNAQVAIRSACCT